MLLVHPVMSSPCCTRPINHRWALCCSHLLFAATCSCIERRKYAQGWEALREIRGPFYGETYAEFMSIVRAAATAPQVGGLWLFKASKGLDCRMYCNKAARSLWMKLLYLCKSSYVHGITLHVVAVSAAPCLASASDATRTQAVLQRWKTATSRQSPYTYSAVPCHAMLCYAVQGFRMYLELFSKRVYFPAICVGVSIAFLVALVDPLSRSYVVYQTLTRAGIGFSRAVVMSLLTLYGSYAVGEFGARRVLAAVMAAAGLCTCAALLLVGGGGWSPAGAPGQHACCSNR